VENKPSRVQLEKKVNELEESVSDGNQEALTILNCLPEQVVYHDSELRVVWANAAACRALNMTLDNFVGQKCHELWHHRSRPCGTCHVIDTLQSGRSQKGEINLPDGNVLSVSCYPIYDRNQKIQGIVEVAVDTTERKQVQEALKFTQFAVDHAADAVFWLDSEGQIIYANHMSCASLGYSCEELLSMTVHDVDPLFPQEVWAKHWAETKKIGSFTIRSEHRRKDGQIFPVEVTGKHLEFGGKEYHCSFARDISMQLQAEKALIESEEKYRTMIERANDGIIIVVDSRIVFSNRRMTDILGYRAEEVAGTTFIEHLHPDEKDKVVDRYQRRLRGENVPERYETIARHKNGLFVNVEVNAGIINFEGETGDFVFVRDITKRKLADKALRESEEKYRLLVENANDAIYIIQDDFLRFWNRQTEKMLEYTAGELATIRFTEFIHPDDRAMVVDRHYRRLRGENPPSTYSYRIIAKSGRELWIQISSVRISWKEQPATLTFLRDITERKKLEDQFQKAQRMEALGTLAGGIAHDFNNLLMAIQGNVSIALMRIGSNQKIHKKLINIESYIQSASELTSQLLGLARGGKYIVQLTNLNQLIQKNSQMFGRTKKEITIRKKLQSDLWSVEVDQGQIAQALLNLYVNAWQAMPEGGTLYIRTENIILDENRVLSYALKPGKYVKIVITDTGTGMDENTRRRIFDPFFTTKGPGRGTGLGLASTYGIIKNHEGIINVFSEKGRGARFDIYLPATEKRPAEEFPAPPKLLKGSETVLLVDDEPAVIMIGREMMEEMGYTVIAAQSGSEALAIYKQYYRQISLVILDIIMPDMGGGDTFDCLKEINPDVNVLLASGYSLEGEAADILKRGCRGFVQKPFNLIQFSQKIREILDRPG